MIKPGARTIGGFLAMSTRALTDAGIKSARLDSELILMSTLTIARSWLLAHDEAEIARPEWEQLCQTLLKRVRRCPIAYLTGWKEFYGRQFAVSSHVLIPRPESEQIIDSLNHLLQHNQPKRLLDVGTGSGCLAITAKLEHPNLSVSATDNSSPALQLAQINARQLRADVHFQKSDLLTNLPNDSCFDIIIANLPYLDYSWDDLSPELAYEPAKALFANNAGLRLIKRLITTSPAHLYPGGYLVLEMDRRQVQSISQFANQLGYNTIQQKPFTLVLQISKN